MNFLTRPRIISLCSPHHRWKNACIDGGNQIQTQKERGERRGEKWCLLNEDELAVGIREQGWDERIENILDTGALDGVVRTDIVLINRLQPPDIVVGVRNQMDVELARNHAMGGVISNELGIRTWKKKTQ